MKRLGGLFLCAATALPLQLPLPALAQNMGAQNAGFSCWNAVTRDAMGMMNARNVSQSSQIVEQRNEVEDLVTGTGRADGRPFSYRCTYNHRSNSAYAVSLSRNDNEDRGRDRDYGPRPPFDNRPAFDNRPPPPPQRDPREEAAQACYNPVLAYAQRQHPTASNFKIFLSDNRFAQQGNMEIRVNGQGELRQLNRQRERFAYSCTYNARNHRVGDISISLTR